MNTRSEYDGDGGDYINNGWGDNGNGIAGDASGSGGKLLVSLWALFD
jgi:hypothetical protein